MFRLKHFLIRAVVNAAIGAMSMADTGEAAGHNITGLHQVMHHLRTIIETATQ